MLELCLLLFVWVNQPIRKSFGFFGSIYKVFTSAWVSIIIIARYSLILLSHNSLPYPIIPFSHQPILPLYGILRRIVKIDTLNRVLYVRSSRSEFLILLLINLTFLFSNSGILISILLFHPPPFYTRHSNKIRITCYG